MMEERGQEGRKGKKEKKVMKRMLLRDYGDDDCN